MKSGIATFTVQTSARKNVKIKNIDLKSLKSSGIWQLFARPGHSNTIAAQALPINPKGASCNSKTRPQLLQLAHCWAITWGPLEGIS